MPDVTDIRPPIKHMPIKEFVDGGYLQEVNRQLLHPLGLALEATRATEVGIMFTLTEDGLQNLIDFLVDIETKEVDESAQPAIATQLLGFIREKARRFEVGDMWPSGVWDYREEPEGIVYSGDYERDLAVKTERISQEWRKREPARVEMLGAMVQPAGDLAENIKPRLPSRGEVNDAG